MTNLFKFLLNYRLKSTQPSQKTAGFTLIELLIGLVLAFLVLVPLLGFMVSVMNSDRQEQAKTNSEQEIQTALDYIARDLEQAVYIYDSVGLTAIADQLPPQAGGNSDGCTVVADCQPVLVFWKRTVLPNIVPIPTTVNCTTNPEDCDDAFVYSLVAYYQIKDTNCNDASTWSCAARIGRFEIRNGAVNPNDPTNNDNTPRYIAGYGPSPGFQMFNLDAQGDLEAKMNNWEKDPNTAYTTPTNVLIDYIDQTPVAQTPGAVGAPATVSCPSGTRPTDASLPLWRKVPNDNPALSSFYACVNVTQTTAQVFIRGNALARIGRKINPSTYNEKQSAYFPSANVQVQGRGFLVGQ